MRLWVWSDLHLEMQELAIPDLAPEGAEVIVCAGDLCAADDFHWVSEWIVSKYGLPVVFVPGNHEFYSSMGSRSIKSDREALAEVAEASAGWSAQVHVLDDSSTNLSGVRFVGGTLWTDFMLDAEIADLPWILNEAPSLIMDYSRIRRDGNAMLNPQDVRDLNRATIRYIRETLETPFAGPTVVVTHHPPHPDCTHDIYKGMKSNHLFANSRHAFEDVLESPSAPSLWVCGHTHQAFDIDVGKSRIVCNPAGYLVAPDERDNGFRWDLLVDA